MKKERQTQGKREEQDAGRVPVRQLNFSSFGTQLETPARGSGGSPTMSGPDDGVRWALPAPLLVGPTVPPVSRRVLRPLIPTFTRRTSAIANESRLAEPEPAATRFCVAPPVLLGPPVYPPAAARLRFLHPSTSIHRTSCPSFFFLLFP